MKWRMVPVNGERLFNNCWCGVVQQAEQNTSKLRQCHIHCSAYLAFLSLLPPSIRQEERGRLHAEMAKMQTLEEEALLKGALTIQARKNHTRQVKRHGVRGGGNGVDGGCDEDDSDSNEGPQTDGDETDGYSDEVHTPFLPVFPFHF